MSNNARHLISDRMALDAIWVKFKSSIKFFLDSGSMFEISAKELSKKRLQEMKFNAMIGDIVDTGRVSCNGLTVDFCQFGERKRFEYGKALLVRWFQKECEMNGEPLRNNGLTYIDPKSGEMCNVRPSTTQFTVRESSAFIEFLYAEGSNAGAVWSEKVKGFEEYPEASK